MSFAGVFGSSTSRTTTVFERGPGGGVTTRTLPTWRIELVLPVMVTVAGLLVRLGWEPPEAVTVYWNESRLLKPASGVYTSDPVRGLNWLIVPCLGCETSAYVSVCVLPVLGLL